MADAGDLKSPDRKVVRVRFPPRPIIDDNGLREITESREWEAWLLYMLKAIELTARVTREKILAIQDLVCAKLVYEKAKAACPVV